MSPADIEAIVSLLRPVALGWLGEHKSTIIGRLRFYERGIVGRVWPSDDEITDGLRRLVAANAAALEPIKLGQVAEALLAGMKAKGMIH